MPAGPGKYDPECMSIMLQTGAEGVILMVLGGVKGEGFSVTATDPAIAARLPRLLRNVAEQIEADMKLAQQ